MAKKKHAQKKESKFTLWQKIAMIILFLLIFIAGVILYSRYIATSKIEVREITRIFLATIMGLKSCNYQISTTIQQYIKKN